MGLDTPGPGTLRQEWVGRGEGRFMVYNRYTMTVGSPTFGAKPTSLSDDRVTPVGCFLRRPREQAEWDGQTGAQLYKTVSCWRDLLLPAATLEER